MAFDFLKEPAVFERAFPKWGFAIWRGLLVVGIVSFLGAVIFGGLHGLATLRSDYGPDARTTTPSPTQAPQPARAEKPVPEIPMKSPDGAMGDNNTIYGNVKPPADIGSGNVIVGPTDSNQNVIIPPGTTVGKDACGDKTSVVMGAGAHLAGCDPKK
jgi:hypothetical protein